MSNIFLFSNLIYLLIIIVAVILCTSIVVFVLKKIYLMNNIKDNTKHEQLGLLINSNEFIARDLQKIKCTSYINGNKNLVIYASDFFEEINSLSTFGTRLKKEKCDFLFYELRPYNIEPLKRSVGVHINDLKEIIAYLKERNNYNNVILIGSGVSSNMWLSISKENLFNKLILLNYSNKELSHSNKENGKIFFGTLFSMYSLIKCSINSENISNDLEFKKQVMQNYIENGFITIREYHQLNNLISKFLIFIKKSNAEIYFLNSSNNSNLKPGIFTKKISNSKNNKISVDVYKESNQFLLNDDEKDKIFDRIICIIEK